MNQYANFFKENFYEFEDIILKNESVDIDYNGETEKNIELIELNLARKEDFSIEFFIKFKSIDLFNKIKKITNKIINDGLSNANYPLRIDTSKYNIMSDNVLVKSINNDYPSGITTVHFYTYEINSKYNNSAYNTEYDLIKEWYINARNDNLFFSLDNHISEFKVNYKYGDYVYSTGLKSYEMSAHYQVNELNFELDFYENILCITYKNFDKTNDSLEMRNQIKLALSFLMDRYIIKIGESRYKKIESVNNPSIIFVGSLKYNIQGWLLPHIYENSNPIFSEFYPAIFDWDYIKDKESNRTFVQNFIEKYIEIQNSIDLTSIFYRYLNCKIIPVEYAIPIITTGLEMFSSKILNPDSLKRMNKDKFKSVKDILLSRENLNKLELLAPEEVNNIRQIIERINNISIGKKLELLVNYLDLDYSDYKLAFEQRNNLNHGSSSCDDQNLIICLRKLNELLIYSTYNILNIDYRIIKKSY